MILSTIKYKTADLRSVVAAFCTLPEELRPTYHSLGEDEPGERILDVEKYLDSITDAGLGPCLTGHNVTYDIGWFDGYVGKKRVKNDEITCNCYLEVVPSLAKQFLLHMASAQPIFGFACAREELEQRNRVIVKQGVNTVESWVGRDLRKYMPGLYWLTLLPNALAEKHGVPISALAKIAQEHLELEGGQHFFRFYERPEDWRSTDQVAKLCASLPGVFDVKKVKPQLMGVKNFLELNAALSDWN